LRGQWQKILDQEVEGSKSSLEKINNYINQYSLHSFDAYIKPFTNEKHYVKVD